MFFGCGTSHNSTSRNLSDTGSSYTLLKFTVALYFHLCDSVSLRHVTVTNSFGMGVIMYDTTGKNLISNSVFSNNVAQDRTTPGGGGVCIEFTYSAPGDFCAPSSPHHNTGSIYDFTNSTFIGNVADHISVNVPTFIIPYACNHVTTRLVKEEVSLCSLKVVPRTILSDCPTAHFKAIIGGQVR